MHCLLHGRFVLGFIFVAPLWPTLIAAEEQTAGKADVWPILSLIELHPPLQSKRSIGEALAIARRLESANEAAHLARQVTGRRRLETMALVLQLELALARVDRDLNNAVQALQSHAKKLRQFHRTEEERFKKDEARAADLRVLEYFVAETDLLHEFINDGPSKVRDRAGKLPLVAEQARAANWSLVQNGKETFADHAFLETVLSRSELISAALTNNLEKRTASLIGAAKRMSIIRRKNDAVIYCFGAPVGDSEWIGCLEFEALAQAQGKDDQWMVEPLLAAAYRQARDFASSVDDAFAKGRATTSKIFHAYVAWYRIGRNLRACWDVDSHDFDPPDDRTIEQEVKAKYLKMEIRQQFGPVDYLYFDLLAALLKAWADEK